MQDPFNQLNRAEAEVNRAVNQFRNPQQQMKQQADMINRTLNQGTANMVSALCYVAGIPLLLVGARKEWRNDPTIKYNAAHARTLWIIMIVSFCSIIGSPLAVLLWFGCFYLASEAVAGRRPVVPFLTQWLMQRGQGV
jgi:hypothetical protein